MRKTDKELLEFAAKAGGIDYARNQYKWNPLAHDGDALRLAIDIFADVCLFENAVEVVAYYEQHVAVSRLKFCKTRDKYASTRRAIVEVAAEIGEAMP